MIYVLTVSAIPIIFATIQILLFVFVFPYETPVILKQQGDFKKLKELFQKIYINEIVNEKITEVEEGVNRKNPGTI